MSDSSEQGQPTATRPDNSHYSMYKASFLVTIDQKSY
jgi:hypothetical protein